MSRDSKYVWHPFTPQFPVRENIFIEKGEGLYLVSTDGKRYMDLISSWWVNLHGHSHPYINQKISEQVSKLEHAIFSGFTHQGAVDLAERLLKIIPGNQAKIFYSDNGSTAVEVAIKMTMQYWKNRGEERNVFIAFENAYHGDTFGGMSVGARNVFNHAFEKLLFDVKHLPLPNDQNINDVKTLMKQIALSCKVAGFIFEPLVQGAAGMKMYRADLLDDLIAFCQHQEIICIADEVMTGFGRTGKTFASDHLLNSPDILCLSKGLTGGYLPLGVTSCKKFIYDEFVNADPMKTFYHGHSYTANPVSCSAALASLDLLQKTETRKSIDTICSSHHEFVKKAKDHRSLYQLSVCGTILALELRSNDRAGYLNPLSETIWNYFISRKMILRPLGNVLYLIPPYCVTEIELGMVYTEIRAFLDTL